MKKILFVINTMGRAGAEMALIDLLNVLVKEKVELSLFVLTGQGEMIDRLPKGVTLLNKKYKKLSVHTKEGKKSLLKTSLSALVKRANGIRLLPYLFKCLVSMLTKKQLLPDKLMWRVLSDSAERFDEEFDMAVAYIEGGSTYYVADHVNAKQKVAFLHVDYNMAGYQRQMDNDCYLKFDKIFTVSKEISESFAGIYPECCGKMETFTNYINWNRIIEQANEEGGFTDGYDGWRILTVGRLMAQKDFAQSIYAMRILKDKNINARWYILGEGEQRGALERLIKQLDLEQDFFLLGAVENPYVFMKQADVYVHATRYEGSSIAVREAQILGCPIVVSDCSGNKNLVEHGIDGIWCSMTPESISEEVIKLLDNGDLKDKIARVAATKELQNCPEITKLFSVS